MTTEALNALSYRINGAAYAVHTALGPGLLEGVYQACLVQELIDRGLRVEVQVPLPVIYKGIKIADVGYRIDILVEGEILLELKSVEAIAPVHRAQLLSYLRLSGKRLGLLINFNVDRLKDQGISRLINGWDTKDKEEHRGHGVHTEVHREKTDSVYLCALCGLLRLETPPDRGGQ
jgi:GxxExxY protein